MKKRYLEISIFAATLFSVFALIPSSARADIVSVTLTSPLSGSPASTLGLIGKLTNTDGTNAYFFIADQIILAPVLAVRNDLPDIITSATFGLPPFIFGSPSISAGGELSGVDLFSLQIANTALPGSYAGVFQLYGDTTGLCSGVADCKLLSTLNFTVNVPPAVPTPESSTLLLLGLGLGTLAFLRRTQVFR